MLFNGVRTAALARSKEAGKNETECAMAVILRESLQLVSDPRNLDGSVEEVFRLMLGVDCKRRAARLFTRPESVTAVVGFGGVLSGACVYRSGARAALRIAALMTGMEFTSMDDTVKDAIGEIGNMLAGAWKGKVPESGRQLRPVGAGSDYRKRLQPACAGARVQAAPHVSLRRCKLRSDDRLRRDSIASSGFRVGIPIFERLQGRCSLGKHRLECCGMGYSNPGTAVDTWVNVSVFREWEAIARWIVVCCKAQPPACRLLQGTASGLSSMQV